LHPDGSLVDIFCSRNLTIKHQNLDNLSRFFVGVTEIEYLLFGDDKNIWFKGLTLQKTRIEKFAQN